MGSSFSDKSFPKRAYTVLAQVSLSYSVENGRFPCITHPSATASEETVRLACVKPAASVRSEPGSNSHVENLIMALLTSKLTRTQLYTPASSLRSKPVNDSSQDKRVAKVLNRQIQSLGPNEGQCRPRFSFFSIQISKNRQFIKPSITTNKFNSQNRTSLQQSLKAEALKSRKH